MTTLTKVTARNIRRRTPQEISELARDAITARKMVTDDPRAVESAFYMILGWLSITPAARAVIGAAIGDYSQVIPGRAMNGFPIFTSVDFLHKHDVPAYNAELARMTAALEHQP